MRYFKLGAWLIQEYFILGKKEDFEIDEMTGNSIHLEENSEQIGRDKMALLCYVKGEIVLST
jgi:hypothetical protein